MNLTRLLNLCILSPDPIALDAYTRAMARLGVTDGLTACVETPAIKRGSRRKSARCAKRGWMGWRCWKGWRRESDDSPCIDMEMVRLIMAREPDRWFTDPFGDACCSSQWVSTAESRALDRARAEYAEALRLRR